MRYNDFTMLPERAFQSLGGKMTLEGGGDSSPAPQQQAAQPTSSTTYATNIPEYAKPYVTNMLEATQRQLFDVDASGGISGFRPYTPYSTDVNNYFAGFSPMQQQAQRSAAGMQIPGQYGQASQMAGVAGVGSLMAGQNYAQQATNPYATQAYMSPYMQNVTDVQKQQAILDASRQLPGMKAAATNAGAFGGSRQAIVEGMGQEALQRQLGQIQATGSQNAFQQAQQAQQFGANLGMTGYGQAGQIANTYAGIGGQELGAQQSIANLQNQFGGQQQALEQQKVNQGIQNYATQQQYPLMQLGMMSNMLRGLPMQSTSTQSYQAAPSGLTQTIAGVGALGSLAGALKKEGGVIKGLAAGGEVQGYSVGGQIKQQLESMTDEQLQQVLQTSASREIRDMASQVLAEHKMAEQVARNPQAGAGLAAVNTGDTFSHMAGGGIIAFVDEGVVPPPAAQPTAKSSIEDFAKSIEQSRKGLGVTDAPRKAEAALVEKRLAELPDQESQQKYLTALNFFTRMGTTPGGVMTAGMTAAKETAPELGALLSKQAEVRNGLAKTQADIQESDRLERLGLVDKAMAMRTTAIKEANDLDQADKEIKGRIDAAKISAAATVQAAGLRSNRDKADDKALAAFIAKAAKDLGVTPDDPAAQTQGYAEFSNAKGMTGEKLQQGADLARSAATVKAAENAGISTTVDKLARERSKPIDKQDAKKISKLETELADKQRTVKAEVDAMFPPARVAQTPARAAPPVSAAPAASSGVSVNTPRGVITFPSQAAADQFKAAVARMQ